MYQSLHGFYRNFREVPLISETKAKRTFSWRLNGLLSSKFTDVSSPTRASRPTPGKDS